MSDTTTKKHPNDTDITLHLTREPEGGYTVTCTELPELITCGDTLDDTLDMVKDAFIVVTELYEDIILPHQEQAANTKD